MRQFIVLFFCLTAFAFMQAQVASPGKIGFDPARNPSEDLKTAIEQAKTSKKRILLDVGGEWCKWCHRLHEFIEGDADLKKAMDESFIIVKVNYSKENKNEEFFKNYPKVPGYPHFFVLSSSGKLLHSQDTGKLESGESYDKKKIAAFIKKWRK